MVYSFAEAGRIQARNKLKAEEKRAAVESTGSLRDFRAGIRSAAQPVLSDATYDTLRAGTASLGAQEELRRRLTAFYGIYEICFPISGERQPLAGYDYVLTQSHFNAAVEEKIGAQHRQFLHTLRDPYTQDPIGGLDFVAYAHKVAPPTVHSCFAFLTTENQGLGIARQMFQIRDKIAMDYLLEADPEALIKYGGFYTFSDQNLPENMDIASYLWDSTTIFPIKRSIIWNNLAYSLVECDFTQPRYMKGGEDHIENSLKHSGIMEEAGGMPTGFLGVHVYFRQVGRNDKGEFILGDLVRPKKVPTKLWATHLRALCIQNFIKSADADISDPTTRKMLAALEAADAPEFLRVTPFKERTKHLKKWEGRIGALQRRMWHDVPNPNQTVKELYKANKAIIYRASAPNAARTLVPQREFLQFVQ